MTDLLIAYGIVAAIWLLIGLIYALYNTVNAYDTDYSYSFRRRSAGEAIATWKLTACAPVWPGAVAFLLWRGLRSLDEIAKGDRS